MVKYGIMSKIENEKEVVLEKIFEGPAERLFKMFTQTEHLKHFWAPRDWELIHSDMDFQQEGEWFYGMQDTAPSGNEKGMESFGKMVFKEIIAPEKIVYVDYFTDKKGEINRELPTGKAVVTFEDLEDNRLLLTSRTEYASAEELQKLIDAGLLQGVAEAWDRLSDYLETLN